MSRAHPVLTPAAVVAGAMLVIGTVTWTSFPSVSSGTRGPVASPARPAAAADLPLARPTIAPPAHRIDLETAPAAELALLPEVGPGMAAAIVADRAVRGPFGEVDALARVAGVGRLRLEAIRPHALAGKSPAIGRVTEARGRRGSDAR